MYLSYINDSESDTIQPDWYQATMVTMQFDV